MNSGIRTHVSAAFFDSDRTRRQQELELIRSGMPVHVYLNLLHTAAITGFLPTYEYNPLANTPPTLRPGAEQELSTQDRLKILAYIVDKALAPLAAQKETAHEQLPNITNLPPDVKNLTLTQLLRLAKTAQTAAPAESAPVPDSVHAPVR